MNDEIAEDEYSYDVVENALLEISYDYSPDLKSLNLRFQFLDLTSVIRHYNGRGHQGGESSLLPGRSVVELPIVGSPGPGPVLVCDVTSSMFSLLEVLGDVALLSC